ncbi:hypothetical protein JO379_005478 [Streptomyces syringium]|uniref:Uncharacterized protein n=1 Tax=Streptomyces syringium TaxID=76729 RepID=A0ABS4YBA0_9ACTN|nr:hypothetical protein [Streptomyces syringium]
MTACPWTGYAVDGHGSDPNCYIAHYRVCSRRPHPEHMHPVFTAIWLRNCARDGIPFD